MHNAMTSPNRSPDGMVVAASASSDKSGGRPSSARGTSNSGGSGDSDSSRGPNRRRQGIGAQPLPRNIIAQGIRGFMYPWRGLSFISEHQLWGLALIPTLINVALLAGLVAGGVMLMAPLIGELDVWLLGWAGDSSWLGAVVTAVSWVVWVAAWAVTLGLGLVGMVLVGQAVASPFLDLLSERIETIVLGGTAEGFGIARTVSSLTLAIGDLVWGVLFLLGVHIPLLFISLLPGLGTAFASGASLVFSALFLSHEFVGLPLTRHLVGYRARWRFMVRNRWLSVPFGMAVMTMFAVPILNLLLLPVATAGGTLMYCDLKAAGRLQTPEAGL